MRHKNFIAYALIRAITWPFGFFPYSWLRAIGNAFGLVAYRFLHRYRKRALSNLALAKELNLSNEEAIAIAKQAFQNLAITCLEYPKLWQQQDLSKALICENPEEATRIYKEGKGAIFFCGHFANWEILFLDASSRMKGIAIGKPIQNTFLYHWIVSIREKNGGRIVRPQNAIKEGLRALRQGQFVGIVGDQGMPSSGYSSLFLGRTAWTSTAPALLAYRAKCPIIFATAHRTPSGYRICYADPIWPDLEAPMEKEIPRMMDRLLCMLQDEIKRHPGHWLWQHNRWKQQTPQNVYKPFRHDSLCIILPQNKDEFHAIVPHLQTLKEIYLKDFLVLFVPEQYKDIPLIAADETIYYQSPSELFRIDLRFKLVFDFTHNFKIDSHYRKLSALNVLTLKQLQALAARHNPQNLSEVFQKALCRPGSTWQPESIHAL